MHRYSNWLCLDSQETPYDVQSGRVSKLERHFVKWHLFFHMPTSPSPAGPNILGGIKRDKLNGTGGFLRKSVSFCENLRFQNAVIPTKSENLQKSVKICDELRINIWLRLSLSFCPFYFPLSIDS